MIVESWAWRAAIWLVVCAGLTAAGLQSLLRSGLAWRIAVDTPNARSLHTRPTPRVGGVVLTPVALAGIGVALASQPGAQANPLTLWAVVAGAFGLGALSFADDRRGLPVKVRFAAQSLAAALIVLTGPPLEPWLALLAALGLMWMCNLYNFMDGSDGLAGSMAVIGFGTLAIGAALAGDFAVALSCVSVAGAALGFLMLNWPPARVFMGDVGSVPLGLLAGSLALRGWQAGDWPWWFGPLAFSPFVADATLTLIARALRGEKVWQAHREHVYQRLVAAGLGHRGTLHWEFGLMLACGALALALRHADTLAADATVAAAAAAYAVFFIDSQRRWPRR